MHILILGANGMLGHALRRTFESEDVTAWSKEHLDVTDEGAVAERIPLLEPDVVLNAAAYTNVDREEEEQEEADGVNGYAVGNLAVTCAEAEIPLVHISTDYVFDGKTESGYAEDAEPTQPVNAYGRSKLLGETLLRENGKNYWLVRTAWLFGPRGTNFVSKILAAAAEKPSITVVDDQFGNPTYTADLAGAIRHLVLERAPYGTYHLVNSGVASRAELAETVIRAQGLTTTVTRARTTAEPTKAARPRRTVLLNTKRPALRAWQEAVRAYVESTHGHA